MKKKAILIGAMAGFDGPFVFLEAGRWLLTWNDDAEEAVVINAENGRVRRSFGIDGRPIEVIGPCRIQARVSTEYVGPGIHLDAARMARA